MNAKRAMVGLILVSVWSLLSAIEHHQFTVNGDMLEIEGASAGIKFTDSKFGEYLFALCMSSETGSIELKTIRSNPEGTTITFTYSVNRAWSSNAPITSMHNIKQITLTRDGVVGIKLQVKFGIHVSDKPSGDNDDQTSNEITSINDYLFALLCKAISNQTYNGSYRHPLDFIIDSNNKFYLVYWDYELTKWIVNYPELTPYTPK